MDDSSLLDRRENTKLVCANQKIDTIERNKRKDLMAEESRYGSEKQISLSSKYLFIKEWVWSKNIEL